MSAWHERLAALKPCPEALEWALQYDTPEAAWASCTRGDWMLWLIGLLSGPPGSDGRRSLVLCASECARQGLPYAGPLASLCERCLSTAERWARQEESVTLEHVREAAAADAYGAYAANAAYDANAAYAANAAAAHASYASYAAEVAAGSDVRNLVLSRCADIVRRHYPQPPVLPRVTL